MALASGTRLGPYEILVPIGAGGMGEVYRAKDTRLDRTVAIKVLPAHVADNAEARQRFEREARAVSSLNHPHICVLYDIGQQEGIDFLVMEYLEGETLTARLAKGPLPVDQALRYAIQIADALAQAHRRGVFHRDLKPGNIMLTKAGAKLLDFGLAKHAPSAIDADQPTVSADLTGKGTIVGTLQYMAPEQFEGKDADARSDIFAFGAVLYEMATGRKAFTGKSPASVIAAILAVDPPAVSTLQPTTPPAFDRLIKRCLVKDPDERWQSSLDLKGELQWIVEASPQVEITPRVAPRHEMRERLAWLVGLISVLAALALGIVHFREVPAETPLLKFSVLPPEKATSNFSATISPDGRLLAFVALGEGAKPLWVRRLDSLDAQALPGTEGAYAPFWSPDSRFLGFFAQRKLKKVEVGAPSGYGSPQTLCNAPGGRGGAWNRDGVIIFSPDLEEALYRVSAAGGPVTPTTMLDRSRRETSHRWPEFLPDGRHFLYWVRSSDQDSQGIYIGALDAKSGSQNKKRLLSTGTNAAYAPGYLLFEQEGTLMAQSFHASRLELTGEPARLASQLRYKNNRVSISVSANGLLTYESGGSETQLVRFDRAGKQVGSIAGSAGYGDPQLSPDGKRVALTQLDPQNKAGDIWLLELSRGTASRLTSDPAYDWRPVWSPDGSRIVFSSNRKGVMSLYQRPLGAGRDELLLETGYRIVPTDWSRDGRFIVFEQLDPKTKRDLWVLPLDGNRKQFPFLQTEFDETEGQISPDGRWMAYTSNESGAEEVYVQSFTGTDGAPASAAGKWRISTSGGSSPRWRHDGKELFYVVRDGKLMAVEVKSASTFEAGVPKGLFETRDADKSYSVEDDGQHFLINTPIEQGGSTPVTVVLNWAALLKR